MIDIRSIKGVTVLSEERKGICKTKPVHNKLGLVFIIWGIISFFVNLKNWGSLSSTTPKNIVMYTLSIFLIINGLFIYIFLLRRKIVKKAVITEYHIRIDEDIPISNLKELFVTKPGEDEFTFYVGIKEEFQNATKNAKVIK